MTAERRYKRLLWAYPISYRRRHGTEIVTTLLEMAEAGHGRPSLGTRLHLVACGVRQRFRLPSRRPFVLIAALLAAIGLGAAAAAGGTWLGWQTAEPAPSDSQMIRLTLATAGGNAAVALYHEASAMKGPNATAMVTNGELATLDRVRAGLAAGGWQITKTREQPVRFVVGKPEKTNPLGGGRVDLKNPYDEIPGTTIQVSAVKDGLKLDGDVTSFPGDARYQVAQETRLRLDAWPVETPFVRPLTVAGMLVGMLAGWLLTAALADRMRRLPRRQRWKVAGLVAAGFAGALAPAYYLYRDMYDVLTYASGSPQPYIVRGTDEAMPAAWVAICAGVVLLSLAATTIVTRRKNRGGLAAG